MRRRVQVSRVGRLRPEGVRDIFQRKALRGGRAFLCMAGEGFEPSKAEPTDLQSVPFDRSGIPPSGEQFRTWAPIAALRLTRGD
jgi:hypothetical protein